jgi:hypothetical protein
MKKTTDFFFFSLRKQTGSSAAQVNRSQYYFEPCKSAPLMSPSLANIIVHLVFSTKGRCQLIRDEEGGQLHAHITGILKNHDSPLIEINSVRDPFTSSSPSPKTTRP